MDDECHAAATAAVPIMTTGDLARELSSQGHRTPDGRALKTWMIRRCYENGLVSEPEARLGKYRLVRPCDVPLVVAALRRSGYLPAVDAPELAAV